MGIVEDTFSDLAPAIRSQRISDAEFDEICRDYEMLVADLRLAVRDFNGPESGLQDDLRSSIAGLRQEILAKLEPNG